MQSCCIKYSLVVISFPGNQQTANIEKMREQEFYYDLFYGILGLFDSHY